MLKNGFKLNIFWKHLNSSIIDFDSGVHIAGGAFFEETILFSSDGSSLAVFVRVASVTE